MGIKITLDTNAVRSLIDEDPDFRVELRNAILAEAVRKSHVLTADAAVKKLLEDVRSKMKAAADKVTKAEVAKLGHSTGMRHSDFSLTEAATKSIRSTAKNAVLNCVADAKQKGVDAAIDSLGGIDAVQARIEEVIDSRVATKLDKLVDAAVEQRLLNMVKFAKGN